MHSLSTLVLCRVLQEKFAIIGAKAHTYKCNMKDSAFSYLSKIVFV